MRAMILALVLVLALAGCANDDEASADDDDPTTTTPPTGDAASAALNETFTHSFAPPAQPATETFVVNASQTADITVTFTSPAGAPTCQGGTASVAVKDPEGNVVAEAAAGTAGVGPCGSEKAPGITLSPGEWTVEFTGSGAVTATVTIAAPAAA